MALIRERISELRLLLETDLAKACALANELETVTLDGDLAVKAELFRVTGLVFHNNHEYSKTIHYYKEAIDCSRKAGDYKGLAIALNNLGLAYHDMGNAKEGIPYFEQSLEIKNVLNDATSAGATYENLGVAYQKISDFKKAVEMFYKSLEISERNADTKRMALTYQNIGLVHFQQEDISFALEMFEKALLLRKDSNDKNELIPLYINLGAMLKKSVRYEEALAYFEKARNMSAETGYKTGMSAALNNIGEIFREQEKYEEALASYLECYGIAQDTNNIEDRIQCAINLSRVCFAQSDFLQVEVYLNQALELSLSSDNLKVQQQIYLLLSQLHEREGDLEKALRYFKVHDELKSKVLNSDNSKIIHELKTKYEVDKVEKENEISRLRNIELKDALEDLTIEKRRSEKLLLNILPEEIAFELKRNGKVKAQQYSSVSVMFSDIKKFTVHSETMSPEVLVDLLDLYFQLFDNITQRFGIEKIKTIGDAYLCVCGLPNVNSNHAAQIISAVIEMRRAVDEENTKRKASGLPFFEFRFGIHSGPVIAGIVGKTKFEYDIWGDTVNTAARMEQSGEAGKINISEATFKLVEGQFSCTPRGKVVAKNKGEMEMYFVDSLNSNS